MAKGHINTPFLGGMLGGLTKIALENMEGDPKADLLKKRISVTPPVFMNP
jgi:hypothetical protein